MYNDHIHSVQIQQVKPNKKENKLTHCERTHKIYIIIIIIKELQTW